MINFRQGEAENLDYIGGKIGVFWAMGIDGSCSVEVCRPT